MPAETEAALVLPLEAVVGLTPQHFAGFPGVFTPGEPIPISELGFETVKEAREAAKESAPLLKEARVPVSKEEKPPAPEPQPLDAEEESE